MPNVAESFPGMSVETAAEMTAGTLVEEEDREVDSSLQPQSIDHHDREGKKKWLPFSKCAMIAFTLTVIVLVVVGIAVALAPRSVTTAKIGSENKEEEPVTQALEDRFVKFRAVVSQYSDPTMFSDPDTAQSKLHTANDLPFPRLLRVCTVS